MPSSLHRREYEVFRNLLQAEREERGLTQIEVAARLDKPQSYVSKYERGERRLDFTEFVDIALVIGLDIPKFLKEYQAMLRRE